MLVFFGFYTDDLEGPLMSSSDVGVWHLYTASYDPSTKLRVIYRDGVQVASGVSNGAAITTTGTLLIGKMNTQSYQFQGTCREDIIRIACPSRTFPSCILFFIFFFLFAGPC